jgi:hypothetical protein
VLLIACAAEPSAQATAAAATAASQTIFITTTVFACLQNRRLLCRLRVCFGSGLLIG